MKEFNIYIFFILKGIQLNPTYFDVIIFTKEKIDNYFYAL